MMTVASAIVWFLRCAKHGILRAARLDETLTRARVTEVDDHGSNGVSFHRARRGAFQQTRRGDVVEVRDMAFP